MQMSTDLLMWNDAHMQSRAKIYHLALLTRKFVKFNVPNVFLGGSSTLVTKLGTSLTSVDNRFITSFFLLTAIVRPMFGLDSPGLGHRAVERCATSLPLPRHLGNAIGHPTPGLDSLGL